MISSAVHDHSTSAVGITDRTSLAHAAAVPASICLPSLGLVRVGIVTNASDNEAGEAVHQTRCLHLKAEYSAKLRPHSISCASVSHDLIAGCNCTVMNHRL